MTTSLRKARQKGTIEDFIKEHEDDPDGNLDKLDEVIKRPVRETETEARPASPRDASDD